MRAAFPKEEVLKQRFSTWAGFGEAGVGQEVWCGGGGGSEDGRHLGPAAGRNRAKVPQAKAWWCLQDYSERFSYLCWQRAQLQVSK